MALGGLEIVSWFSFKKINDSGTKYFDKAGGKEEIKKRKMKFQRPEAAAAAFCDFLPAASSSFTGDSCPRTQPRRDFSQLHEPRCEDIALPAACLREAGILYLL